MGIVFLFNGSILFFQPVFTTLIMSDELFMESAEVLGAQSYVKFHILAVITLFFFHIISLVKIVMFSWLMENYLFLTDMIAVGFRDSIFMPLFKRSPLDIEIFVI